jgi:hypothetical protein
MARLAFLLTAFVVAAGFAGCGNKSSYPTAPVSGTIKLDGKPLGNASVTFQPVGGGMASFGITDSDGHFELKSMRGEFDGAVVAKHNVVIRAVSTRTIDTSSDKSDPTAVEPIPKKYNDATELTMQVPESGRDDADFNLSSK